jgi:hypothetical protein
MMPTTEIAAGEALARAALREAAERGDATPIASLIEQAAELPGLLSAGVAHVLSNAALESARRKNIERS